MFYNDFNTEGTNGAKANGAFDMVSALVAAGVPIDGMGLQMHTGPWSRDRCRRLQANIALYAALGLQVEVTEMDVTLCSVGANVLGLKK